jgi:hypothetical protein
VIRHAASENKEAKQLLRAAKRGDVSAVQRMSGQPLNLNGARFVVARENGCESWDALCGRGAFKAWADDMRCT